MREARRSATLLLFALALTTGCSDLFMVELGRGQIGQVLVDRVFPTGPSAHDGCPDLKFAFEGAGGLHGDLVIAPLSEGCLLSVHVEEAVLLNAGTMKAWATALSAYDLSALVAIELIVDELGIDGGRLVPLGPNELRTLEIALDERVLFDEGDLASMDNEETDDAKKLRLTIPHSLVDRFVQALHEGRAFTGTLDVRLVLRRDVAVPRVVHVRTLLQPVLLVDGWDATF